MGELLLKAMKLKHKVLLKRAQLVPSVGFQAFIPRNIKKIVGLVIINICIWTMVVDKIFTPRVIVITGGEIEQVVSSESEKAAVVETPAIQPGSAIIEIAHAEESGSSDLSRNSSVNSPQQPVIETIKKVAKEKGFKNVDGLLRLAMCESSMGRKLVNHNNDTRKTTDNGLWMINDYWHSEVSYEQAMDFEWSTAWTIDRINAGELHEWNCSGVWDDNNYIVK